MKRRLLNVLTVLSLLLCVAVCVLWVRSYRGQDVFQRRFYRPARILYGEDMVLSAEGELCVQATREQHTDPAGLYRMNERHLAGQGDYTSPWQHSFLRDPRLDDGNRGISPHVFMPEPQAVWESAGFFVRRDVQTPKFPPLPRVTYTTTAVSVPYWFFACLSAVAPAIRGLRFLREHRRVKANRCARCGYDLTANATGVCPECGTPVTAA